MAEIAVAAALGVVQIFLSQRNPKPKPKIVIIEGDLETMRAYLKDTMQREQDIEGAKDRKFVVDVPEHFHKHKISIALHNISHKVMDWRAFHRLSSRTDVIQAKIKSVKELDPFRKSSSGVTSSSSAGEVPDMAYPVLSNDELVGMERVQLIFLSRKNQGVW
ncbi:hypothetical protein PVL29_025956 [Vitis rotundifolia]|uniref:Uncharacterized protein n=1 Tax=Vitis rotundifolia TaxID=103349 RepID=A0AA39D5D8_VITRO|nr:hypothetical protein PVL29_025956 [Vitis rotundifolia]